MKRNILLVLMTAFLLGACGQDDDQAAMDEGQMTEETGMAESEDAGMEAPGSGSADEGSGFQADADNDGTLDYEINVVEHPE